MAKSSGIGTRIYQKSPRSGTPIGLNDSGEAPALCAAVEDDIGTGRDGSNERARFLDLSCKRSSDRLSGIFP